MRYLLHHHPAFPGLLSKEDLYALVDRGSLARGDLCTDVQTGRDHTVGEVISGMRPPRAHTPARVERPAYQEFRADDPYEEALETCDEEESEAEDAAQEEMVTEFRLSESGERIYSFAHPSWLSYWKALFLMLLFLVAAGLLVNIDEGYALVAVLAGIATFICIAIARASQDYIVTDERVEHVWGILGRSSKEVRVCDIRSIDVHESGLKGLLGLGTLEVSSAGTAGVEVRFRDMRRAHDLKQLIRQLQRGDLVAEG
jgi:membrane protein YdbS with pleckstrin-like domain